MRATFFLAAIATVFISTNAIDLESSAGSFDCLAALKAQKKEADSVLKTAATKAAASQEKTVKGAKSQA